MREGDIEESLAPIGSPSGGPFLYRLAERLYEFQDARVRNSFDLADLPLVLRTQFGELEKAVGTESEEARQSPLAEAERETSLDVLRDQVDARLGRYLMHTAERGYVLTAEEIAAAWRRELLTLATERHHARYGNVCSAMRLAVKPSGPSFLARDCDQGTSGGGYWRQSTPAQQSRAEIGSLFDHLAGILPRLFEGSDQFSRFVESNADAIRPYADPAPFLAQHAEAATQ